MPKIEEIELRQLIKELTQSNPLMDNHVKAIRIGIKKHHTPKLLVKSLKTFQDLGLFSGESARDNFKKALSFIFPKEMAEAMRIFVSNPSYIDEERDHAKQAYFNYIKIYDNTWFTTVTDDYTGLSLSQNKTVEWTNIAIAFKCLYYKTDLLTGALAASNFNALMTLNINYISVILNDLAKYTKLLEGSFAQVNFNLLVDHKDLRTLVDVLLLFTGDYSGLLNGELAQTNFEIILSKTNLAEILTNLYDELGATEDQSQFDDLMEIKEPRSSSFRMGFFPDHERVTTVSEVARPTI